MFFSKLNSVIQSEISSIFELRGGEAYICHVPCSDSGHFTVLIKYQNDFPCTVLNEEAIELQVLIAIHLLLALFLSIALF